MNDYNEMNERIQETAADFGERADECVSRNPAGAILFAIGAGLVIGLCVRALRPPPTTRDRLAHVLDDLESRLRDTATPVFRRASELASDGLHDGEARIERLVRDGRRRFRKLFA